MKSKSTLLLMVISISTLIVTVIGTAFAFFANGYNSVSNTVNASTSASVAFSSIVNKSVEINAGSVDMSYDNKGEWAINDVISISIGIAGNIGTYCTYDVVYIQNDDSDIYTSEDDENGGGFYVTPSIKDDANTSIGGNAYETSLKFTGKTEYNSIFLDYPNNKTATIVENGKITIVDGNQEHYTFLMDFSFENLDSDQVANAGKNFRGLIDVKNIKCYDNNNNNIME